MNIEAMKQALEALQANDVLINGSGTHGGLFFAMDGYYSGCFDIDGTNEKTEQAITALRQAIEQAEKREWVGLTNEEVNSWELPEKPTVFEFAQFVEAKLKEKNG